MTSHARSLEVVKERRGAEDSRVSRSKLLLWQNSLTSSQVVAVPVLRCAQVNIWAMLHTDWLAGGNAKARCKVLPDLKGKNPVSYSAVFKRGVDHCCPQWSTPLSLAKTIEYTAFTYMWTAQTRVSSLTISSMSKSSLIWIACAQLQNH